MDRENALEMLTYLKDSRDTEMAHSRADDVLCDLLVSLGYSDVVEKYNEIDKWFA